jgi:hypothetical protein
LLYRYCQMRAKQDLVSLWFFAVSALVAAIAPATSARAFCQTTTCNPDQRTCERDARGCVIEGQPLHWSKPSVAVVLDTRTAAAAGFDAEVVTPLVRAALKTWERAACSSGRTPALHLSLAAGCTPVSADIVLRFEQRRVADDEPGVLGASDVEFDGDGALKHVVIRVLAGPSWLTTDDVVIKFDLLSTLVHELGHALGLSHSTLADAVMLDDARRGQLARTLADDDRAAICAVYAPTEQEPQPSSSARSDASDVPCASTAAPGCSLTTRTDRRLVHGFGSWLAVPLLWSVRRAFRPWARRSADEGNASVKVVHFNGGKRNAES